MQKCLHYPAATNKNEVWIIILTYTSLVFTYNGWVHGSLGMVLRCLRPFDIYCLIRVFDIHYRTTLVISWFDIHCDHSTFPDSTFIQTIQHFLIRHSFRPFNISWFDIHSDHLTFHDSTFIQTIRHSFIASGPPPWGVQTIDISLFNIH